MARDEKTSARVAKIAARIMASPNNVCPAGMVVAYLKMSRAGEVSAPLYWRDVRALAVSALTQTADKREDRGFDPRDGGKIGWEFIPKAPQVRKALRGKLGKRVTPARILSKKPSSWPPSAKPPRRSP